MGSGRSGAITDATSADLRRSTGGVLRNVQILRAVAALLVVVAHLNTLLTSVGVPTRGPAAIGTFGAATFFTISGFIMVYTTRNGRLTPWTFMANRIVRIVPFYWAITIALFFVALTAPEMLQATRADWSELAMSLAFIPFEKANGLVEPLLFVGWTLNYEIVFYILFAFGLSFANKSVGMVNVILCLLCFVVAGQVMQPNGVIARFYTDAIILEFALGMLIALALPYLRARANSALKGAAAMFVVVGAAAAILLPYGFPGSNVAIACGVATAFILAGAVALERWGWVVRSPLWLLLGDASYSIYLTHPFVTQVVEKMAQRLNAHGLLACVLLAFAVAGSCIVGVVVYRTVERPLWHLARRALVPRRIETRAA